MKIFIELHETYGVLAYLSEQKMVEGQDNQAFIKLDNASIKEAARLISLHENYVFMREALTTEIIASNKQ